LLQIGLQKNRKRAENLGPNPNLIRGPITC